MTRFFSSSNLLAYLFFLILVLLIWVPNIIIGYQDNILYTFHEDPFNQSLHSLGNGNIQLLGFFIISILAAGFNIVFNQTDLVRSNTILPALLIFILHSLHPFSPDFLRLLFAEAFILLCLIRILRIERQLKTNSIAFDCGLLIGITFWLIPILGLDLIFVLIAISTLKAIHWREVFWAICGFILPGAFLITTKYLVDIPFSWFPPSLFPLSEIVEPDNLAVFDMTYYICFGLLTIISLVLLLVSYTRKTIRMKNLTSIFIFFLFIHIIVLIICYFLGNFEYGFILLSIPLSTIVYSSISSERFALISKVIFFVLICDVLVHNWYVLLN